MLKRLIQVLASTAFASCAFGQGASQPTTLHWLSTAKNPSAPGVITIDMNSITWDSANDGGGQGSLQVTIDGVPAPAVPNVSFTNVVADANGYVQGGVYTVPSGGESWTDLFGSGLGVTLPVGTSVTLNKADGSLTVNAANGFTIQLPCSGPAITDKSLNLKILQTGEIDLVTTGAGASNVPPISVPGASITASSLSFNYKHVPGQSDTYQVLLASAAIQLAIPGISCLSDQPISVTGSVSIDQDGQVSTVTPDGSKPAPATVTAMTSPATLSDPLNFGIQLSSGTVTLASNKNTGFTLVGQLFLPPEVTATVSPAPNSGGQPSSGIPFSLNSGDGSPTGLVVNLQQEIKLGWTTDDGTTLGLDIPAPASGAGPNAILDLSSTSGDPREQTLPDKTGKSTQLPVSWKGLYIVNANITVPDGLAVPTNASSTASGNLTLSIQNAFMDGHKFNGYIQTASPLTMPFSGFTATINQSNILVIQNVVKSFDLNGSLTMAQWTGNLNVEVSKSQAGALAVNVSASQPLTVQNFADFTLTKGSFTIDQGSSQPELLVSGNLHFAHSIPKVGDAVVTLSNVGVGPDGKFMVQSAWLDLPNPVQQEIGPLSLQLSQIGFGYDPDPATNQNDKLWIGLTGGVSLSGDLPIQVQGNFGGLKISSAGPSVSIKSIEVDCDFDNIFSISGQLDEGQPSKRVMTSSGAFSEVPVPTWPTDNLGNPMDAVSGNLSFGLDCFSGLSTDCDFMVAKGSWFALIGVLFPGTNFPIPETGLGIYGVWGGVGKNVKPDNGQTFDTGLPVANYGLIPDAAAIHSGANNYVFTAGARIGLDGGVATNLPPPGPPLWGDVGLVLAIPNLDFGIAANLYLLEDMSSSFGQQVPAIASQADRVISGSIGYDDPSKTFQASASANLYFPTQQNNNYIIHAHGGLQLLIDPATNTYYFHAGGPIDINPAPTPTNPIPNGVAVTIENPLEIDFGPNVTPQGFVIQPIQGAIDVDFNPKASANQNALAVRAAFQAGFSVNESGSVNIGVTDVDYVVAGSANALGYINFDVSGGMAHISGEGAFEVSLDADLGLSASFGVFGDASVKLQASAEADLGAGFDVTTTPAFKGSFTIQGDVDVDVSLSLGPWNGSLSAKANAKATLSL